MEQQSPFMAILADESEQAFAHQVANAMGYPYADIVIGTPLDAGYALSARASSPRYVLIDIGTRSSEVLPEIDTMAEQCEAGTRVIVIGAVNDVKFYRELRQRGVIEYFTRPAKVSDVRAALSQDGGEAGSSGGQVITFMSAASGDGSSTVALNTAYALAHEYKQSTVIIDMDFQFGMVAKNLDLHSPFGIKDLFEHPDRGVDSTLVERMMSTYGDKLKVIASPNDLRLMPTVKPELIRDLIQILREHYDFVIIDLPHIWSMWVSAALSNATHNVMVAQLWLRSVTHCSRLLGTWRDVGIDDDHVSIIVNRSGAKFKEAVSSKDFERVCDKKIAYYLANDIKTVVAAENQGKTVIEIGNAMLARQFREFAGSFLGIEFDQAGVKNEAPAKPVISNLFARKSS